MTLTTASQRHLCSRVSLASREDPIGFALPYERYLFVELPTPWPEDPWTSRHAPEGLNEVAENARNGGLRLRLLALAPEAAYSEPGKRRVLRFCKPQGPFAQLERLEYHVPDEVASALTAALLETPETLPAFDAYRQETGGARDLMVCTHGSVDLCCAKFGYPLYEHLKRTYANESLRVWRTSHFGGHRFAPTVLDLPSEHYWAYLTPEVLEPLATRTGDVARLRAHYRGWAGVGHFAQVAECEAFMLEGWRWTSYLKQGEVLSVSSPLAEDEHPAFAANPPEWVEVRLHFRSPDARTEGHYDATVAYSGTVRVLESDCGTVSPEAATSLAHQYRVSRLTRMPERPG